MVLGFVSLQLSCFIGCSRDDSNPAGATGENKRWISLAPHFTDIIIELGGRDRLVGVTQYCEGAPESVARLGGIQPDLERIISLKPDRIFGLQGVFQRDLFEILGRRGFQVEVYRCESIADVRHVMRQIGQSLDAKDRVDQFEIALDRELAQPTPAERPKLLFVIGRQPHFRIGGPKSFAGEMVQAAGLENLFADNPELWPRVDFEEIVRREPDVIVDTTVATDAEAQAAWSPFRDHLAAVRQGALSAFPPVRPGPQIVDWIKTLREIRQRVIRTRESSNR